MTYLQLVNKVLRRLRESTVSSVTESEYSSLVGELVNQAKEDVEDAWDWLRLRSVIQVSTTASTYNYTLTGSGTRSRILGVNHDGEYIQLRKAPSQEWMRIRTNITTTQEAKPVYYMMNGYSGDDYKVDLWPVPDSTYTIDFHMVVPQAELSDDADELVVPSLPVILRAYALAISERGEDGAAFYTEVDEQYNRKLHDAISFDMAHVPEEQVWS